MKPMGIVRKVDELGTIVIPIELRKSLGLQQQDPLEIYVDMDKIILKKYKPACIFCSSKDNVKMFKNKLVCSDCLKELKK